MLRILLIFLLFTFLTIPITAQNNPDSTLHIKLLEKREETTFASLPDTIVKPSPVEMATGLRSNGKIYVVVAVLVIILAGLFFYLIRLDRKITRLEKGIIADSE